jgi:hypothetical protein
MITDILKAALLTNKALAADKPFTTTTFLSADGTTARTTPARWADWHNVKEYGATGNGTTDDTVAIQATIDWVNTNPRGTIYFPRGTYKVTSPLTLPLGSGLISLCLVGEGEASTITGNVNGFIIDRYDPTYNDSFSSTITVEKLKIINTNNVSPIVAQFTGTSSGTNLTVSGITGTLAVGDYLIGMGTLPNNARIASQTSGTPGGNGVYVTTVSTAVSGADITAWRQAVVNGAIRLGTTQFTAVRDCTLSGVMCALYNEDDLIGIYGQCGPNPGSNAFNCSSFPFEVMNVKFLPVAGGIVPGSFAIATGNQGVMSNCDIDGFDNGICSIGPGNYILGGIIKNCNYGVRTGTDGLGHGQNMAMVIRGTQFINNNIAGFNVSGQGVFSNITVIGNGGQYGIYTAGGGASELCTFISCLVSGSFSVAAIILEDFPAQHAENASYNVFIGCNASNSGAGVAWQMPLNAPSAQFINSNNPAAQFAFTTLPDLSAGTAPEIGDEFLVSNSPTATSGNFATVVTVGGGSNHVKLRWNGTGWMIV